MLVSGRVTSPCNITSNGFSQISTGWQGAPQLEAICGGEADQRIVTSEIDAVTMGNLAFLVEVSLGGNTKLGPQRMKLPTHHLQQFIISHQFSNTSKSSQK